MNMANGSDDNGMVNDNQDANEPSQLSATESRISSETSRSDLLNVSGQSTSFSVSSNSSLFVPNKLFTDLNNAKKCYMTIINEVDPNKNTETQISKSVLMLSKEQILAGIKSNKVNYERTKNLLADLLGHVRPLCLPDYQQDTRPKITPHDTLLNDLATKIQQARSEQKIEFETLKSELETLKASLSSQETFLSNVSRPVEPPIDFPSDGSPVDHQINPIDVSVDDFVSDTKKTALLSLLNNLPYNRDKGRSTAKFGENYKYNGSRGDPSVEFPPLIKELLDEINEQYVGPDIPLLNSCLVTKYEGPGSYIPLHSDDERSIHPESSIFTISMGKEATVKFTDMHGQADTEHVAKDGSLYAMTRRSQGVFKHSIDKNATWSATDVRYSITFRSFHWRNNNSTVLLGDSNTG